MKSTRIVRLEAENIKRLRAVSIEPDGSLVVISGRNGAGKSSVLDAIWMALGGAKAIPPRPVRKGEKKGVVRLELDSGLVVTRTIKPSGTSTLAVTNAEGAKYPSPQAMLDGLVGGLSFDPLAFARASDAKQLATLKKLAGLDFTTPDAERAELYAERTGANRRARDLAGQLASAPHHADAPDEEVSVAALAGELADADHAHAVVSTMARDLERAEQGSERTAAGITTLREQAERVRRELGSIEETIEKAEKVAVPAAQAAIVAATDNLATATAAAPDRDEIRGRLAGAEGVNREVRANARRREIAEASVKAEGAAEKLTAGIDAIDEQKRAAIAGATYPLPGLAVDDDGVLLDGLPFSQASSAEQLRASVAMGLALHPQLRVLLVRDGSILDEDSLRLVAEMAAEADAQVWIEMVGSGDGPGIIIEDGAVK